MKPELTNQELLERYLRSLTMMLPHDKAGDIAAEIRSNLESLIEDRAAELGRQLSLEELSAILRGHGHPLVVASRYRTPETRGLISPHLFPFYWFTLRAVFALWVTIRLLAAVFTLQGEATVGTVLPVLGRDVLLAVFFIGGGITLLFALWEHLEHKYRCSERWKPETLPPIQRTVRQPEPPRPTVLIVGHLVMLIFGAAAMFLSEMSWVWGSRGMFSPSEAVYAMRVPIWLLALVGLSQSWLNYTRFARTEWRRFLLTAVCASGVVLAVFLLSQGDLLVAGPKWVPAQAEPLASLNQIVAGLVVLACILAGLVCASELRRSLRRVLQTADSAC